MIALRAARRSTLHWGRTFCCVARLDVKSERDSESCPKQPQYPSRQRCESRKHSSDGRDKNLYRSPVTGEPHRVAYVAVFLDIPKPTLYHWMQQGDLPYETYGGLTDRHISIETRCASRPPSAPVARRNVTQSV